MNGSPAPGDPGTWGPTAAHARAVGLGLALLIIGVLGTRPDALVLATPLVVVATWSALRRPGRHPSVDDRLTHHVTREGDGLAWGIHVRDLERDHLLSLVLGDAPWIDRNPGSGAVVTSPVDGSADLHLAVRVTRWGIHEIPAGTVVVSSVWRAFVWTATVPTRVLTVLPDHARFRGVEQPAASQGLVGQHRSIRRGEGNEFAGIRPFAVGDRMRRINWPRSVRGNDLVVNATWADQDAHVQLLIDATDEFGTSGGVDGPASSLDQTVRAAAAVAEYYTRRGDRVSVQGFGAVQPLSVPPGTGRRHLRRVLRALTLLRAAHRPAADRRGPETPALDRRITVMLSPLIAPSALDRAVELGRSGNPVVVVDTLPAGLTPDDQPVAAIAWRIRLLQRDQEISRVQELGIPVVGWTDPTSLDRFLGDLARRARRPRLVRR